MSSRWYPLYQRGNPQLRIFLPNFWMKLIRPEEPLPGNMVLFQTSVEMTHHDVKNYLEKIYKVPVVDVKTTIRMGSIKQHYWDKRLTKEDDYKEALVILPREYKFEFPNIIAESKVKEMERYRKLKEDYKNIKRDNKHRLGIPQWFSSI